MKSAEAAILGRIFNSESEEFSREVARSLLKLDFDAHDLHRMHELAVRGQGGDLTPGEQNELESYRRIGRLLELMRSKARRVLTRAGQAA